MWQKKTITTQAKWPSGAAEATPHIINTYRASTWDHHRQHPEAIPVQAAVDIPPHVIVNQRVLLSPVS